MPAIIAKLETRTEKNMMDGKRYEEAAKECSNFINEETLPLIWNNTHLISIRLILSRAFRWYDNQREKKTCEWKQDEDNGCWDTSCGHLFEFSEGGPQENRLSYCWYCGRRIAEVRDE